MSAWFHRIVARRRTVRNRKDVPSRGTDSEGSDARYSAWLAANNFTKAAANALSSELTKIGHDLPLVSIVMRVCDAPVEYLNRAIQSVADQVVTQWQLCIVDDGSRDRRTVEAIGRWADRDARIAFTRRVASGSVGEAYNSGAKLAIGEFLAFLNQYDELAPDALAEITFRCLTHTDVDLVYSDHDKIDATGNRFDPQFKPDWSPTLLLCHMYLGGLLAIRRSLFHELHGMRSGYEDWAIYDLALRAAQHVRSVGHVPKILYHQRLAPISWTGAPNDGPARGEGGRRAVVEAFERYGVRANVNRPAWAVAAGFDIFKPTFVHSGPKVSILITTRNRSDLLRACLHSLNVTRYRDFEVIIVADDTGDIETPDNWGRAPLRIFRAGVPANSSPNFAHTLNRAVQDVSTDYILLLDSTTVIRTPDWLSQMMGYAQISNVGVVGARLLSPDGMLHNAGPVHDYNNGMDRGNAPASQGEYMTYTSLARECSAVTAACMLTPRSLFHELGGFDEVNFPNAYYGVDYCYRSVAHGNTCVYCPIAELTFSDDQGRSPLREIRAFQRRYGRRTDPWHNPNLSCEGDYFRIRPYHLSVSKRPVRAVMVTHNLNLEGAPSSQLELTLGLARDGIVDPVVLSPSDGPLRYRYEAAGITVRVVNELIAELGDITRIDRTLDMLAAVYHQLGAEVVYANTLQTFWAIDAGEWASLPTLWNIRESEAWQTYFDFLPSMLRQRAYTCFAYPYRVIFVAHATRRQWHPLESKFNFTVIHNGLEASAIQNSVARIGREEARRRTGVAAEELAIVLVGTVCERKNQIDLIRAIAELPRRTVERLRCFIVGDRASPYSAALHGEIRALSPSVRRRIVVVDETDQVPLYYAAADIAVCTSRVESFPRVILEAMACGLPIVTTPVFGIREQVREGVNALFYEPGNSSGLASALERLSSDDAYRNILAMNSRLVLESLPSYDDCVARYAEIFREARFSKGQPYNRGLSARRA